VNRLAPTTSQVSINQTLCHFCHCTAQCAIGQIRLAHPTAEMAGFEDPLHFIVPLSGIVF
jgi:hypothetical protein